ncbi:MAG: type II toxin-antitoxin system TacA family antitoxin [Bacilli bacterium]
MAKRHTIKEENHREERHNMSSTPPLAKTERIEARVNPEVKMLIEEAANVLGVSVSNFIIGSAQSRADEVIRNRYVIDLTMQQSRAFAEALLYPPGPNEALQRAKALYDESMEP